MNIKSWNRLEISWRNSPECRRKKKIDEKDARKVINVEKTHFSFPGNSSASHKNRFLADASLKLARLV